MKLCRYCLVRPGVRIVAVTPRGNAFIWWACPPCRTRVDRAVAELRAHVR